MIQFKQKCHKDYFIEIKATKYKQTVPHLQIIRKFRPPRVSRVHRDESSACWVEFDLATFEHESGEFGSFRVADGEKLLGDDRQDFDVDSIELIEATPSTRLG